ncbi:hypothetical protein EYF80_018559 [Liparis tanakae]|uniref:Uncharacterized protein n=1 Tax=Liparis tanakae TaxID=230148 RepID=A0A4Z2I073_9TELE|nr:hypothetical protein EYF80_018559 [Liparis tanakae]
MEKKKVEEREEEEKKTEKKNVAAAPGRSDTYRTDAARQNHVEKTRLGGWISLKERVSWLRLQSRSLQSLQWARLRVASGDSASMSTWACSTVDSLESRPTDRKVKPVESPSNRADHETLTCSYTLSQTRNLPVNSPVCIPVSEVSEYKLTALVGPHVQLLGELGDHQERPPALPLLGLEDVSEDVVPDVDDVLPFGRQQVAHDVGGTWEEDARGRLIT